MSTSWSSTGSSVRDEKTSSPVRYRQGPLDYEPPILCRCGAKAGRWISWSNDNPGRRYLTCYRARFGGCDFYEWLDPKPSEFLCQTLRDLRDAVYGLKNDKGLIGRQLEEALKTIADRQEELRLKNTELSENIERLEDALRKVCCLEYIEIEHEEAVKLKDKEIEHLTKKVADVQWKNDLCKFALGCLVVVVVKLAFANYF